MSEKRAIDLAYEIIWGTRPLKDVHKALGEIIARENAELIKLRDTAPVTGDAAWFQRYNANVKAMAAKAGYVGEEPLAPRREPDDGVRGLHEYGVAKSWLGKHAKALVDTPEAFVQTQGACASPAVTAEPFRFEYDAYGLAEDVAERREQMAKRVAGVPEPERRCKTPRYELEAVDDKRQARRGPVKIDEAIRARTKTSGAEKGSRVAMVDRRKPFTNAYRPKLSLYGVKMKVVDKQEQHGVTWLKCEFPLESGERVRRWFADDGRLILWGMYSPASHAKT
jgi:hypothetical protein